MWKTWSGNTQATGPIAGPQTAGPGAGALAGWQPTILYLIVLLAVEIFVAGFLSRTVLR